MDSILTWYQLEGITHVTRSWQEPLNYTANFTITPIPILPIPDVTVTIDLMDEDCLALHTDWKLET